jgi:hypothetical protein
LQIGYPFPQVLLVYNHQQFANTPACTETPTYQAFDEHLKVLRRLQLCKDLVSIDELPLLFWPFPLVGQDLRASVDP